MMDDDEYLDEVTAHRQANADAEDIERQIAAAVAAERERCAAMCECIAVASENGGGKVTGPFGAEIARKCAALILKTRGA